MDLMPVATIFDTFTRSDETFSCAIQAAVWLISFWEALCSCRPQPHSLRNSEHARPICWPFVNGVRVIGAGIGRNKFIAKWSKIVHVIRAFTSAKVHQKNSPAERTSLWKSPKRRPQKQQRQNLFSSQLSFGGAFRWQIGMRFLKTRTRAREQARSETHLIMPILDAIHF